MHKNIILCIFIILIILLLIGLLIYKNKSSSTSSSTSQQVSSELFSESEKPLELQVTTSTSYKKPCLENKSTVYAGCQKFVYGNKDQALKQCGRNLSEYTLITKGIENEDPCLLKRSSAIILTNCKDKETKKNKAYFTDNARIKDKCVERIKQDRQWIGDGLEYKDLPSNFDNSMFKMYINKILNGDPIEDLIKTVEEVTFFPAGVNPHQYVENANLRTKLYYKISLAGLMFVYGLAVNDKRYTNLRKGSKDFLYAIYLLSPAQFYPYVFDGEKEYSTADLYNNVMNFDNTYEGITLWKKIINFNYNNDSFKSLNNLINHETQDLMNTPQLGLISGSYIFPMNFYNVNIDKLHYYKIILDNPNNVNPQIFPGLKYAQNIGNLTYLFGIIMGDADADVLNILKNLIEKSTPLIYDIKSINTKDDILRYVSSPFQTTDENYRNISSLIGRYVLRYIALPSPP